VRRKRRRAEKDEEKKLTILSKKRGVYLFFPERLRSPALACAAETTSPASWAVQLPPSTRGRKPKARNKKKKRPMTLPTTT